MQTKIQFGVAQEIGANSPQQIQQDRIKAEVVRTAGNRDVLLAVVADGEGGSQAGQAAKVVVDQVFNSLTRSSELHFSAALRQGFELSGRGLFQAGQTQKSDATVAATAVAIARKRLYMAHAGHTCAFLVRDGKVQQITQPNGELLGASQQPRVYASRPEGQELEPGDQIVLASDGLQRISPEDGRPFVQPEAIASYLASNPPLLAARHLISIAMGRDVDDNISVAVLEFPAKKRQRLSWIWIALLVAVFAGVFFVLQSGVVRLPAFSFPWQAASAEAPAQEFGFAVLVEGQAWLDQNGQLAPAPKIQPIQPPIDLISESDVKIQFQSSRQQAVALAQTILYAEKASRLRIKALDSVHGDGPASALFEITAGRMLLRHPASEQIVRIEAGAGVMELGKMSASLAGFEVSDQNAVMDCLQGTCIVTLSQNPDEILLLEAGERLVLDLDLIRETEPVPEMSLEKWDALCGGCLSVP